jgi:pimeloyl-ACP methyl ester carboxylesterase
MESVDQWDSRGVTVFPELAKKFRAVALDCRGHGKSDKPHDPKQYDDEVFRDVLALLDHLKIEKANLIGYSAGCSVALRGVLNHPDRVLRVTLISGTGNFEPLEADDLGLRMKKAFEGDDNTAIQLIIEERKVSAEEARAIVSEFRKSHDGNALAAWMQGVHIAAPEITASQLAAIKKPMLILFGSKEVNEVDRARIERFSEYSHGEVHCIDGANHDDIAKNPKTLELIQEFLLRQNDDLQP